MNSLIFLSVLFLSLSLGLSNITFVILSQNNNFKLKLASELQGTIKAQSKNLNLIEISVYISPIDFNISGDWTIFPLLTTLLDVAHNSEWVVLLEDRCNISLNLFNEILDKYDSKEEIWIGRALYDTEATIIHHFAFYEDPTVFKYPHLGSGIIFSIALLKKLHIQLIDENYKLPVFHIDPIYEFALFVYNNGKGPMVINDMSLCLTQGSGCAIYPKKLEFCGEAQPEYVYFAVKTCKKFHENRVKAVKGTWAQYSPSVTFFSDVKDTEIPTIDLGVQNTEQGHCKKTVEILKYVGEAIQENTQITWIALVDDDTILSVSRLTSLITCYDTKDPLILGERYRFGEIDGFDYATGGAGTLINRAALNILVESCTCFQIDSPDDMTLGKCAESMGINIVHIPQMHQARPPDYAPGRLANKDAITFHKHWMIDPVEVYRQWFEEDDKKLQRDSFNKLEL